MKDLYAILGVSPTASADEIRRAHRELVAKLHPDRHHGHVLEDLATERLAEVNAAYDVLSDPERRAEYDRRRAGGPTESRHRTGLPRWAQLVIVTGLLLAATPLVLRFGVRLVQLVARLFAAARGTPYGLAAVIMVVLAVAVIVRIRRKRRSTTSKSRRVSPK